MKRHHSVTPRNRTGLALESHAWSHHSKHEQIEWYDGNGGGVTGRGLQHVGLHKTDRRHADEDRGERGIQVRHVSSTLAIRSSPLDCDRWKASLGSPEVLRVAGTVIGTIPRDQG